MNQYADPLGVNQQGHLTISGADVAALAKEYGTPAYIMSEDAIRQACRAFTQSMKTHYPGESKILYASKALSCKQLIRIANEEGLGADVVSGGELYTALEAGLPADRLVFHGNNKTAEELRYAIESGVGCIVLDNRDELALLEKICGQTDRVQSVALRLKPGIEAHTHDFIQTGQQDSKFGLSIQTGEAMDAAKAVLDCPYLTLLGVHCHIGSQIFESHPFGAAVVILMDFMAAVRRQWGFTIREINLGGGFGIRYTEEDDPRDIPSVVKPTAEAVCQNAERLSYPLPCVVLEPGRSIVGPAGLTVYTIGSVKHIPEVGTYLSVDGGMTDNIRYALYGAKYRAALPERAGEENTTLVSITGRCCESGDFVGRDIPLPAGAKPGDLLCVLGTGAYNYSMASHYNRVPKPPVVMVRDGQAYLAVRRETWQDMARYDV